MSRFEMFILGHAKWRVMTVMLAIFAVIFFFSFFEVFVLGSGHFYEASVGFGALFWVLAFSGIIAVTKGEVSADNISWLGFLGLVVAVSLVFSSAAALVWLFTGFDVVAVAVAVAVMLTLIGSGMFASVMFAFYFMALAGMYIGNAIGVVMFVAAVFFVFIAIHSLYSLHGHSMSSEESAS